MAKWEILKDIDDVEKGEIYETFETGDGEIWLKNNQTSHYLSENHIVYQMIFSGVEFPEYFKKIEDVQVGRAKKGEGYWSIASGGSLCHETDNRTELDNSRYWFGNYYLTEGTATRARDRQQLITDMWRFQQELENGWMPVWGAVSQPKYTIIYNHKVEEWWPELHVYIRTNFYLPDFQTKETVEKMIKHFGDRLNLLLH